MGVFWYKTGDRVTHVVHASTLAIARWYAKDNPWMRGATFFERRDRSATDIEAVTVLAHAADKALIEARDMWRANGGSVEYQRELDRLCRQVSWTPWDKEDES